MSIMPALSDMYLANPNASGIKVLLDELHRHRAGNDDWTVVDLLDFGLQCQSVTAGTVCRTFYMQLIWHLGNTVDRLISLVGHKHVPAAGIDVFGVESLGFILINNWNLKCEMAPDRTTYV